MLPAVEGDRLEGESRRRRPTEEPEGLADQEGDETPTTVRFGHSDTGRMLGHEVNCICQGGGQGKDDCDGHVRTSGRAPASKSIGGFWALVVRRSNAPHLTGDLP